MATYTTNYNLKKPDSSDPFGDFRGDYNDNLDIIDANLGGGGGSGGHTIVDPDGNSLPQEDDLQFTGAVSVTDDNVNGRTVVNVSVGNNLILDASIFSTEEKQVGVWTDKKPLYKKTWELTVPNASGTYTYNEATPNLEDVVHTEYTLWGIGERGDTPWYSSATILFSEQTDTGIEFYFASNNYAGRKIYFTSYYTKTTDTAGSGGYEAYGFSPVIYSDVERVIGVWRDNKPLYQKTVHIGSLTFDTNWHNVPHGITNIDKVISCEGIMFGTDGSDKEFYPLPNYRSNTNQGIVWGVQGSSSEYIAYINNWYSATNDTYATLRYTKTTDVAGSGDYNTYGVPTVHYDTNEQVIGTWINGKPLYQKTITFTSNAGSGWTDYVHGIPNIDKRVEVVGYVTDGSGNIYTAGTNSVSNMGFALSDTYVSFYTSNSYFGSQDVIATIKYTKNTD